MRIYMETDDENDCDDDGVDDAHGMLEPDRSMSGKNQFIVLVKEALRKAFGTDGNSNKIMEK